VNTHLKELQRIEEDIEILSSFIIAGWYHYCRADRHFIAGLTGTWRRRRRRRRRRRWRGRE